MSEHREPPEAEDPLQQTPLSEHLAATVREQVQVRSELEAMRDV